MKYVLNETQLTKIVRDAVFGILNERKVLKLGNGSSQSMDMGMPPQEPSMMQPPMGGDLNMGAGNMPQGNEGMPPMGGDDGATAGESDFDTNFDAGVEADEDTDPKKFIQQLTGKLSQSLSSYNNENGMDTGLCKYVANMIIKQAAKGLDEKDRKDIIKAINTTSEENDETDNEMPMDGKEQPDENMGGEEEQPMMERRFTKAGLRKLLGENINPSTEDQRNDSEFKTTKREMKKGYSGPFVGKKFN